LTRDICNIKREIHMSTALKINRIPAPRWSAKRRSKRTISSNLRSAQFKLDRMLHDLRGELSARESKLRDEYLDRVAEITAA
jgi:hypothetical protein